MKFSQKKNQDKVMKKTSVKFCPNGLVIVQKDFLTFSIHLNTRLFQYSNPTVPVCSLYMTKSSFGMIAKIECSMLSTLLDSLKKQAWSTFKNEKQI